MEKPFKWILERKWMTLFCAIICATIGIFVLLDAFMPIFAIPVIFCALAIDFSVMDSLISLTSRMTQKKRISIIGLWLFSFILCIVNIFICIIFILIESGSANLLRIPPSVVFIVTGIAFALTVRMIDIKQMKQADEQSEKQANETN